MQHAELLERWLMEGAYNKVLAARDSMPDPAYAYFMQRLLNTVRCGPMAVQALTSQVLAALGAWSRSCAARKGVISQWQLHAMVVAAASYSAWPTTGRSTYVSGLHLPDKLLQESHIALIGFSVRLLCLRRTGRRLRAAVSAHMRVCR